MTFICKETIRLDGKVENEADERDEIDSYEYYEKELPKKKIKRQDKIPFSNNQTIKISLPPLQFP